MGFIKAHVSKLVVEKKKSMSNAEENAWHLRSVQNMVAINIILFEH